MSERARVGLGMLHQVGPRSGIELFEARVGARLVRSLADLDWVVYTRGRLPVEWNSDSAARVVPCAPRRSMRGGTLLAEQVGWPLRLRGERLDLLVALAFAPPIAYRGPFLLAVHDLAPLARPQDYSGIARAYWHIVLRQIAPRARRIITPSHWVQRECAERLGIPADRIDVVHSGVEPKFSAERADASALSERARARLAALGIGGPFWLHCGTVYPRKNLQVLLHAMGLLRARRQVVPWLVSVGGAGPHARALERLARDLDVGDRLRFAGRLSDEELVALYTACDAFVFPSWSEGFGVPPLEALAAGAPVLAAHATCLPEILGDAVEWADPGEPESWITAWQNVAGEGARTREERVSRGAGRAARYTWEETARRAGEAIRAALSPR